MPQSKIIIGIVIAALVIVGGYAAFKQSKAPVQENAEQSITTNEEKKMAFAEFIKKGGSYKCTVHQSVGGMDTVGTTYIHNGMIRGEYNNKVQGSNIDATLIVKDGYSYTWTSMYPTMGFKSKINQEAAVESGAGASGTYSFDAEQIGDYECESWPADNSKFEIPTNITFRQV